MTPIKNLLLFFLSIFAAGPSVLIPTPALTPALQKSLPDYHLIKAPFIQQAPKGNWDQPWQDACEEAALLTLAYFYQNLTPSADQQEQAILAMIDFETRHGWLHDVTLSQMARIGEKYLGYKTEIRQNPSAEIIKQYLLKDTPVIIPANGKTLFRENRHFKNGGPWYHNLVILGYDDRSEKFIVHDVGTRFGAYFHYSYGLLLDSIHDFPQSGQKKDINQGAPAILILVK